MHVTTHYLWDLTQLYWFAGASPRGLCPRVSPIFSPGISGPTFCGWRGGLPCAPPLLPIVSVGGGCVVDIVWGGAVPLHQTELLYI